MISPQEGGKLLIMADSPRLQSCQKSLNSKQQGNEIHNAKQTFHHLLEQKGTVDVRHTAKPDSDHFCLHYYIYQNEWC